MVLHQGKSARQVVIEARRKQDTKKRERKESQLQILAYVALEDKLWS